MYAYRRNERDKPAVYAPYVMREDFETWHWSDASKRAAETPFDPELCGTPRGYRQHRRFGDVACQPCKDAMAVLSAAQKTKARNNTT